MKSVARSRPHPRSYWLRTTIKRPFARPYTHCTARNVQRTHRSHSRTGAEQFFNNNLLLHTFSISIRNLISLLVGGGCPFSILATTWLTLCTFLFPLVCRRDNANRIPRSSSIDSMVEAVWCAAPRTSLQFPSPTQLTTQPHQQHTPQYLQINYGNTGTISRRESLLSPSAGRREKQLRCIAGKLCLFIVIWVGRGRGGIFSTRLYCWCRTWNGASVRPCELAALFVPRSSLISLDGRHNRDRALL